MLTRRRIGLSVLVFFCLILVNLVAIAQEGQVIRETVYSPSLEGNLLGDSPNRQVTIYLPPGYDVGDARYPVIYYLHGYTGSDTVLNGWWGIHNAMNNMIKQGNVQEMIIVMPNAYNKYGGSWYANSSVAGNYEDYITKDLVEFIDSKYRTLAQRGSRAIAGASMGGHGAMKLAIKYTNVYCAVVSHRGVVSLNRWKNAVRFNPNAIFNGHLIHRAMAIAFSPNPDNLPLYFDYPADEKGNLLDDIWQRWLEHDPVTLVKTHRANLKRLAGIYFDHGRQDTIVSIEESRDLDKALAEAGIPHVYEEHGGNHLDLLPSRISVALLFLSDLLSSEMLEEESIPPDAVTDLAATDVHPNEDGISLASLTLTWTASGDDGKEGRAIKYDIRYSNAPITDDNYYRCPLLPDIPIPKASDSKESLKLNWLKQGTYYFAMRVIDDCYNYSDISNVLQVKVPKNLFYEVAEESGLEGEGNMALVLDYNDDGNLDILLPESTLYANNGNGTFTDVSEKAKVGDYGAISATAGDYDDDGDVDIYVARDERENVLYRSWRDGKFVEVAEESGVNYEGRCSFATFVDYDNDGDLDIYVVNDGEPNLLYRNNGDDTFTDVAEEANVAKESGECALFFDCDGDFDIDMYLVDAKGKLYKNQGDGTFTETYVGITTKISDDDACVGDYDNDGDFDLFIVGYQNALFQNDGEGLYTDVSVEAGVDDELSANAANFIDYDNDGDLDIYVVNGREPDILYINNGDETFSKRADPESVSSYPGETAAFADFDNDGDVDIYIVNRDAPGLLYLNNTSGNNWLHVKLIGTVSNTDSIGAKVTVVSEGLKQIREVQGNTGRHSDSLPVEFGLGKRTKIQQVKVEWQSGLYVILEDVAVNQLLVVEEPEGVTPTTWAQIKSELLPNYPNPSNPETWIPYRLAKQADVKISIYNVHGQLVRLLSLGEKEAGNYINKEKATYWNGRNSFGQKVASGVYFYTLQAGSFFATRKMIILK